MSDVNDALGSTEEEAEDRVFDDRVIGVTVDEDDEDVRVEELYIEGADAFADTGPNVVELAFGQRSWRFGHVIVDEAQDLTPMQWRMIVRRARRGSMTIVGDLAQRSTGMPTSWRDVLPASITSFDLAELTINYRSPSEINDLAADVLSELAPDLTPAQSIRSVGEEPLALRVDDLTVALGPIVRDERERTGLGKVAVIGVEIDALAARTGLDPEALDITLLDPRRSKGLEFDSVIVVEPADIVDQRHGLSLLYVALTRATHRLTLVHQRPLPDVLARSTSPADD